MASLTVRNLTVHTLALVKVERFEGHRVHNGSTLSNVTSTISGCFIANDHHRQTLPQEGPARDTQFVSDVRVPPFTAEKTDVRGPDIHAHEVIRLAFAIDGKHYDTDVPSPSAKSAVMRKLDGGPLNLTVVFVPSGVALTVFSSSHLHAWMQELHDEWPLSMLSVPGTHNAPTCHKALPSVRCQAVSVPEQLRNGVRFLDVRVSVDVHDHAFALVHSVFPISLTGTKYFRDLLHDLYHFLEENPSETILLSLKREGTGKGTDEIMSKHLKTFYADKKKDRWFTEPKVPKLGEARGRIVLIRRFAIDESVRRSWDGRGYGIDAEHWPDNCEDGHIGGGQLRVQDFYEITESQNIEKKIGYSRGHLERAASQGFMVAGHKAHEPTPPVFINFLSASNFFSTSCWPERIAAKVNPAVIDYLCLNHGEEGQGPQKLNVGSGGTGIVVTDWVGARGDWDLIRCIVGMNARLQYKQ